jgi:hypothetical protein
MTSKSNTTSSSIYIAITNSSIFEENVDRLCISIKKHIRPRYYPPGHLMLSLIIHTGNYPDATEEVCEILVQLNSLMKSGFITLSRMQEISRKIWTKHFANIDFD